MDGSRKKRSRSTDAEPAHPEALACPACARRYPLEERFCSHCGMPLVYAGGRNVEEPRDEAHERARKIRPELTRGELVRVGFARNQAEAELMQNLLIEEGVPSVLRRAAGFDVPDFLAAGPRDVLVPQSGLETAREVLLQAEVIAPHRTVSTISPGRVLVGLLLALGVVALVIWGLSLLLS